MNEFNTLTAIVPWGGHENLLSSATSAMGRTYVNFTLNFSYYNIFGSLLDSSNNGILVLTNYDINKRELWNWSVIESNLDVVKGLLSVTSITDFRV